MKRNSRQSKLTAVELAQQLVAVLESQRLDHETALEALRGARTLVIVSYARHVMASATTTYWRKCCCMTASRLPLTWGRQNPMGE